MLLHKQQFIAFVLVFCLGFATGNASGQTTFTGTTMGPIAYKVVLYDPAKDAPAIKSGIEQELEQINSLMSTYIDDSDVTKINSAAAGEWTLVSPLTLSVIKRSLEISMSTEGAFDITVGPAVRRWKFGPNPEAVEFPTKDEVDDIRKFVGFKYITIQAEPPAIKKSHAKTEIDLSAIAKGYAVDQVASFLKDRGHSNFMVEVGGEVYASGRKPDGAWRIGIEKPQTGSIQIEGAVEISNVAVATSGDYRNFVVFEGKRISHTIDPKTCRPVENPPASCSVIAKDCMTSDAIATAVMVMGSDAGHRYCEENNVEANIITRSKEIDSKFTSVTTSGFPEISSPSKTPSATREAPSIWPTFIGTMVVFSLAIAGMAVGAIFNQKPITGSCGGIATQKGDDGDTSCGLCHKPVTDCPDRDESEPA